MQQEIRKINAQVEEQVVFQPEALVGPINQPEAMTVESLITPGKTAHQILQELAK